MLHEDPAFDVIMRHLNLTEEQAYHWVDYIAKFTYGEAPPIFDLIGDLTNLEALERSLSGLVACLDHSAMTLPAHDSLYRRLSQEAFAALVGLEDNISNVRAAIQATKREINQSKFSKKATSRINMKGIQLVNSARDVWRLSTGTEAPTRGLNPASKFGKFLYDLFGAYEIEGDAKAAFNAWVKHVHTSV